MGGLPHHGMINKDWNMVKSSVVVMKKLAITRRKTISPQTSRAAQEEGTLKILATSSKYGHDRFQTFAEKEKYEGTRKRGMVRPNLFCVC